MRRRPAYVPYLRSNSPQRKHSLQPRFTAELLEERTLLAVLTVTHTADDGPGSFRQALITANGSAGQDTIRFAIPATDTSHFYYRNDNVANQVTLANVSSTTAGEDTSIADLDPDWPFSWFTLAPLSPLPALSDSVIIDGYSQGTQTPSVIDDAQLNTNSASSLLGLNTVLRIELSGQQAGALPNGLLHATASEVTIRGLTINRTQGPKITLAVNSQGNVVAGNFVGTDVSGSRAFPAPSAGGVAFFDAITAISTGVNEIGGLAAADRNLISGNVGPVGGVAGIYSGGPNRIRGNLIGTDRSGTRALANARGLYASAGNGTQVGGPEADAGNLISGNQIGLEPGLRTGTTGTLINVVQRNSIGTDITGTKAIANGQGISLGSATTVLNNTIAFNGVGVRVAGLINVGNRISQNSIFSNTEIGIDLDFDLVTLNDIPPDSVPPDSDAGPNGLQNYPLLTAVEAVAGGTRIRGTLHSTPNSNFRVELFANATRTERAYRDEPLGKYGQGQTFIGSVDVNTNSAGQAEFVAELAVNLLELPGTGGQPFITATATDTTSTPTGPRNNTSEFSPIAVLGGCGPVVNTTDTGIGTLREALLCAATLPEPPSISFDIAPNDARHFYYANDGIAGQVSLNKVSNTIAPNDSEIVGMDPDWPHSWFSIQPTRALPTLSRRTHIDGYTQPGSQRNTIPTPGGLNSILKIELDGTLAGRTQGLQLGIGAELSRIEGLAVNSFRLNGLLMTSFGGNSIVGNFVGTDVSGTLAKPNSFHGIRMTDERYNRIGGTLPADRNLLSGNNSSGIMLESTGGDVVAGNLIGWDATGIRTLPNGQFGVNITGTLYGSSLVTVGGLEPAAANRIASSRFSDGVVVDSLAFTSPFQSGNPALLLADCFAPFESSIEARDQFFASNSAEDYAALETVTAIFYACATTLGGKDFVAQANPIIGNRITSATGQLAIDLNDDGRTPNDSDSPLTPEVDPDFDGGPNNLQNYPMLTNAVFSGNLITVQGSLTTLPSSQFRLEFYISSAPHAATSGGGEQFLGAMLVTADANGHAEFEFSAAGVVVPQGSIVSATATLMVDLDLGVGQNLVPLDTSEFSLGLLVQGGLAGDLDQDGDVDSNDLLDFLANWTGSLPPQTGNKTPATGDLDGDRDVDSNDLLDFLSAWTGANAQSEPDPIGTVRRPLRRKSGQLIDRAAVGDKLISGPRTNS